MASTIILSDNGASSGSAGLKQTAGNDGVLILQTTTSGGTATNAVYADTSQNVGVGGITPSAWSTGKALEIGQVGSALFNDTSNNRTMMMQNLAFVAGSYQYQRSAAGGRVVLADGSFNYSAASSGTAGTSATLSNIILAAKGQSFALEGATQSAGTGIAFPATQSASTDANTLDDYEEGTWTTTFASPVNMTGTPSLTLATYTKVGRLVYVVGRITGYSVTSSNTATYPVLNLPFSMLGNSVPVTGSVFAAVGSIFVSGVICDNSSGNATEIALVMPAVSMTTSGSISIDFSLTYQTT